MPENSCDRVGTFDRTARALLSACLKPLDPVPTGMAPGGHLSTPLQAILFDVYGTLLISGTGDIGVARRAALASDALQRLLEKFHVSVPPDRLLGNFFDEIRKEHQSARERGVDYPEVQIESIWARVLGTGDMTRARQLALEFELIANPVCPMPHLASMLSGCRSAGLVLGVISNAQFYTPLLFRWFLGADLTDIGFREELLIYSYELGYAKPSPKIFGLAAARLKKIGISPQSVLYLGNDLQKDVLPAARTGFQTALFAGDARSLRLRQEDPACRGVAADLVLTDLRQLLPYLRNHDAPKTEAD